MAFKSSAQRSAYFAQKNDVVKPENSYNQVFKNLKLPKEKEYKAKIDPAPKFTTLKNKLRIK